MGSRFNMATTSGVWARVSSELASTKAGHYRIFLLSKYASVLKQNDTHEKKPFSGSVFSYPCTSFELMRMLASKPILNRRF